MAISSDRTSPLRENSRPHRYWAVWGVLTLLICGSAIALVVEKPFSQEDPTDLFQQARWALINQDYSQARDLASRVPPEASTWAAAQLIAGEACTRMEEYEAAVLHYHSIPRDDSAIAIKAAMAIAEIYRHLGSLTKAEPEYEYVLRRDPSHPGSRKRLAYLLAVSGQIWKARPHLMHLVRHGEWSLDDLALLGDLERLLEHGEYLRQSALNYPDDLLVQMGLAANAIYLEGDAIQARDILQIIVAKSPEALAAQAMLGELLVDEETFPAWHAQLPSHAAEHPDIWFARGLWARHQNKLPFAARCFWETVRRIPTHRRGNYQLGQVLKSLEDPRSEAFMVRAGLQFDLTQQLDYILSKDGQDEPAMKRIVEILEQTGRIWEACAWAKTAGQYFPQAAWPRTAYWRMQPLLDGNPPQTIAGANLASKYDLSHFPDSDEELSRKIAETPSRSNRFDSTSIHFRQTENVGLDFVYFNGDDATTLGVRIFEQSGGGVGVCDFDGDRWPDLYFTQGAKWIHGQNAPIESPQSADQMYRNLGGEQFFNVTQEAGLGNQGFGQGVSAGDFNGDGFPDLYVANVGRNRLYENNGDGTFSDVTQKSGLDLTDWTSSCIVVDLNADGLPDLFDVNYLTGQGVYSIICQKKGCSPSVFKGLQDRLHINKGDGTFHWVKDATPATDAKGLGVVAFDLHERGRPCLFVANDQVPNHFLLNHPSNNSDNIRLENQALLSGLGFNMDGLAMACMGIAVDDANGDNRLDIFVTNFKSESNTLYLQDAERMFIDQTHVSGLLAPSLPMTGWGTQFLDADLDGSPDLVVANGHVYPEEETEYRMRAQFFHNQGNARFAEVPPRQLGPYFERKHVGRSLARLDWNRDGLMDCVISNINEPAALLTNTTETQGHFLEVKLLATTTARDAIGSEVEVEAGGRRWTKQLIAGDGFQASNERLLHFGLGANDLVTSLKVTWPSGATTVLKNLPADGMLELVEGTLGTCRRGDNLQSLAPEL